MKKAFLVLVFLAVCGNAYSAELLIHAKPHWMDSLTEKEVAEMDEATRQSYEARSKVGDVIAVRPDGWAWGKEEGLPNYVVVKVPMTVEEAQKYEEQLIETVQNEILVEGKAETVTTQVLKRRRKYAIPDVYVSTAKTAEKTDISIASKDVTAFKSAITEKVGLSTEVKPPVKNTIKTDLQSLYKKHLQKYVAVVRTFWVENAWAATQLKKTVCPSGCDYTALETCMNANEQNLVTADQYFDVEISGEWSSADSTAVTIHNYTTDATRYINIYTTGDARHEGVWDSGKYILHKTGNAHQFSSSNSTELHMIVDGLQIYNNSSGDVYSCMLLNIAKTASKVVIKNNILKGGTGTRIQGIRTLSNDGYASHYIFNNIIYGFTGDHADTKAINYSRGYGYIYSNTVYGSKKGIIVEDGGGASNVIAKNNISYNNGTDYSGTFSANSTHNLSKDTTAPALNTYYVSKTLSFVSTTGGLEDLHLASTDTDAIDHGSSTSGESAPLNFTTDIDGVTRSGTWDIGADEFASTGAPSQIF
jgi:hypothetical protein